MTRASNKFDPNSVARASLGVTDRELEVLGPLSSGSNKDIAVKLRLSPNTVKTHVGRLYEKLETTRRIDAIQKARDLGLIE